MAKTIEWLKPSREFAKISQSELARRTSLYQANISEIENDLINPNLSTIEEYLQALGLKLIPISKDLTTIAEISIEVRAALTEKKEERALRLLFEFVNRTRKLGRDEFILTTISKPPKTLDERFDAFIAALVDYLYQERRLSRPNWVQDRNLKLTKTWTIDKYATKKDKLNSITPKQFLEKNILISPRELTSA